MPITIAVAGRLRLPMLLVLVAGSLVLAACSGGDGNGGTNGEGSAEGAGASIGAISADRSPSESVAWPISDGRVDAAVAALPDVVDELMARSGVPGVAVAVVYRDEVVFAEGFGVRSTETGEPVDADTVFQLASASKPLGSTAIAAAVTDGVVSWDDLVTDYLPDFELSDPASTAGLTIRDAYAHRSGLPDHAGDLLEDLGYDRDEVLRRLRYVPVAPIRSRYAYTNFGMTAGGVAAASAAGMTWEDFTEAYLYEPLGMTDTSSRFTDYQAAGNRAVGHVPPAEGEDGQWLPMFVRDPDAQSPAGGASSTVNDLARWMRLQLGGGTVDGKEIVGADELLETHAPQMLRGLPETEDARAGFYGLGWDVGVDPTGRVLLSHSGAFNLGFASAVTLLPSEELGILVLTNGQPHGVPEAIAATFMDLVEFGEPSRDWLAGYQRLFVPIVEGERSALPDEPPEAPTPPRSDSTYTGVYDNDFYGPAEIAVAAGGGLELRLGPDPMVFPLTHWDGDVFIYETVGENASGKSAVTFTVENGEASSVVIEALDHEGLGTFVRGA